MTETTETEIPKGWDKIEGGAEVATETIDDSVDNATIAQRVFAVIGLEKELSDLFAGAAHVTPERFDDFLETVDWEKFNP